MLKNVTLSAEERLIERARKKAAREHRSLNVLFRQWLSRYVDRANSSEDYFALMKRLRHVRAGKHFSRDELNER